MNHPHKKYNEELKKNKRGKERSKGINSLTLTNNYIYVIFNIYFTQKTVPLPPSVEIKEKKEINSIITENPTSNPKEITKKIDEKY